MKYCILKYFSFTNIILYNTLIYSVNGTDADTANGSPDLLKSAKFAMIKQHLGRDLNKNSAESSSDNRKQSELTRCMIRCTTVSVVLVYEDLLSSSTNYAAASKNVLESAQRYFKVYKTQFYFYQK